MPTMRATASRQAAHLHEWLKLRGAAQLLWPCTGSGAVSHTLRGTAYSRISISRSRKSFCSAHQLQLQAHKQLRVK